MRLIIPTTLFLIPLIGFASFPVTETHQIEIVESIYSELPSYSSNNTFWGIFSLSCVLLTIILVPNVLAMAAISLLGVISGAIGFNKKRKGLAITGFVLSIIFFIISFLVLGTIILLGGVGGAFGG